MVRERQMARRRPPSPPTSPSSVSSSPEQPSPASPSVLGSQPSPLSRGDNSTPSRMLDTRIHALHKELEALQAAPETETVLERWRDLWKTYQTSDTTSSVQDHLEITTFREHLLRAIELQLSRSVDAVRLFKEVATRFSIAPEIVYALFGHVGCGSRRFMDGLLLLGRIPQFTSWTHIFGRLLQAKHERQTRTGRAAKQMCGVRINDEWTVWDIEQVLAECEHKGWTMPKYRRYKNSRPMNKTGLMGDTAGRSAQIDYQATSKPTSMERTAARSAKSHKHCTPPPPPSSTAQAQFQHSSNFAQARTHQTESMSKTPSAQSRATTTRIAEIADDECQGADVSPERGRKAVETCNGPGSYDDSFLAMSFAHFSPSPSPLRCNPCEHTPQHHLVLLDASHQDDDIDIIQQHTDDRPDLDTTFQLDDIEESSHTPHPPPHTPRPSSQTQASCDTVTSEVNDNTNMTSAKRHPSVSLTQTSAKRPHIEPFLPISRDAQRRLLDLLASPVSQKLDLQNHDFGHAGSSTDAAKQLDVIITHDVGVSGTSHTGTFLHAISPLNAGYTLTAFDLRKSTCTIYVVDHAHQQEKADAAGSATLGEQELGEDLRRQVCATQENTTAALQGQIPTGLSLSTADPTLRRLSHVPCDASHIAAARSTLPIAASLLLQAGEDVPAEIDGLAWLYAAELALKGPNVSCSRHRRPWILPVVGEAAQNHSHSATSATQALDVLVGEQMSRTDKQVAHIRCMRHALQVARTLVSKNLEKLADSKQQHASGSSSDDDAIARLESVLRTMEPGSQTRVAFEELLAKRQTEREATQSNDGGESVLEGLKHLLGGDIMELSDEEEKLCKQAKAFEDEVLQSIDHIRSKIEAHRASRPSA